MREALIAMGVVTEVFRNWLSKTDMVSFFSRICLNKFSRWLCIGANKLSWMDETWYVQTTYPGVLALRPSTIQVCEPAAHLMQLRESGPKAQRIYEDVRQTLMPSAPGRRKSNRRVPAYLELLATRACTGPTARSLCTTGRRGALRGGLSHVFRGVLGAGVHDGVGWQKFRSGGRGHRSGSIVCEGRRWRIARGRSRV